MWRSPQWDNIKHKHFTLLFMRVKVPTAFVSLATTALQRSAILRASSTISRNETVLKPFFRIYYNDVYEVNLPPQHRFPMNKYAQVRHKLQEMVHELSEEQQNLIDCEFCVSPLATFDELATTHSIEYINRFLSGDQTEQEQRNVGFPWSKQGVDRALSSVGGTLAAARDVCQLWQDQRHLISTPAPFAAHIAGGTHHAFYDRGEGFSVFSDMAVAANVVMQEYPSTIQKVLMVDLDVHQGNGNAVLFANNPRVVTFSLHCVGNYFSKKEDSDLDIELPIDCTDQTYLMTLHHWLNQIHRENEKTDDKIDLIFFQAGVDVLEVDRLGRMSLSQEAVSRRNNLMYGFAQKMNVPMVICMGGGYPRTDDWTPIIEAHANVYFEAHQYLSNFASLQ